VTKRTIIIGDIHGMLDELRALLKGIDVRDTDRIVCVGDLVHKGPDSVGVVKLMRSLGAELVEGNHDGKQTRFRKALDAIHLKDDELTLDDCAARIKMSGRDEMVEIERLLNAEDAAYLATVPLWAKVPGGIVVHGGILPEWKELPDPDVTGKFRKTWDRMTRVRHIRGHAVATVTVEFVVHYDPQMESGHDLTEGDLLEIHEDSTGGVLKTKRVKPEGGFVALGREKPDDPFWADVYDGRFGHVYFGHQPYPDSDAPVLYPHATALDLGCVFGGHLAAVVLEEGQPTRAFSVKASKKYATGLWEE
jgi:serine/threonine protein phosphatase 1